MKIAKIICDQWELVEITYTNGIKFIFRKIRKEREQIIRYLFQIKRNFLDYLKRPDTKQIELEFFIKEYNKIPTDLRDDEEMKAELHQRVEDLRDNLYKVCDIKKEESEKERETIMNNGWLPDKIGFLINNYITLMQVSIINLYFLKLFTSSIWIHYKIKCELDRFQDTALVLKDYYKCMHTPVPDEWPKEFPKIGLIEVN